MFSTHIHVCGCVYTCVGITCILILLTLTTHTQTEDVYSLKQQNDRLRRQTHEMETFLNDYGLIWVGYRASEDGDAHVEGSISREGKGMTGEGHRLTEPVIVPTATTHAEAGAETDVLDLGKTQVRTCCV
jgi:hypothetical protein